MNGLTLVHIIANAAQFAALRESGLDKPILLYLTYVLIFVILIVVISLPKLRKIDSHKNSFDGNAGLLDNLSDEAQLTPDEKRKIRDAMVRNAFEKEKKMIDPGLSVNQLALLASQGKDAMTEMLGIENNPQTEKSRASEQTTTSIQKAVAKKPAASPEDLAPHVQVPEAPPWESEEGVGLDEVSAFDLDQPMSSPPPATAQRSEPGKSVEPHKASVDLDMLLEQGLLSQKDYNRIRRLANHAEKKKSHP